MKRGQENGTRIAPIPRCTIAVLTEGNWAKVLIEAGEKNWENCIISRKIASTNIDAISFDTNMDPSTYPLDFLKLLAHDVRWQLIQTLAESDQHVQELVERLKRNVNNDNSRWH